MFDTVINNLHTRPLYIETLILNLTYLSTPFGLWIYDWWLLNYLLCSLHRRTLFGHLLRQLKPTSAQEILRYRFILVLYNDR